MVFGAVFNEKVWAAGVYFEPIFAKIGSGLISVQLQLKTFPDDSSTYCYAKFGKSGMDNISDNDESARINYSGIPSHPDFYYCFHTRP